MGRSTTRHYQANQAGVPCPARRLTARALHTRVLLLVRLAGQEGEAQGGEGKGKGKRKEGRVVWLPSHPPSLQFRSTVILPTLLQRIHTTNVQTRETRMVRKVRHPSPDLPPSTATPTRYLHTCHPNHAATRLRVTHLAHSTLSPNLPYPPPPSTFSFPFPSDNRVTRDSMATPN